MKKGFGIWSILFLVGVSGLVNGQEPEKESATRPDPDVAVVQAVLAKQVAGAVIVHHCTGQFTKMGRREFAVAVRGADGKGSYWVMTHDKDLHKLAEVSRVDSLECKTPAQAKETNQALSENEIVHGAIRADTPQDLVCGFVSDTDAQCWSYDAGKKTFVDAGGWST